MTDYRLVCRATVALVRANARYWITVAPRARAELRYWHRLAEAIPDPTLRRIALAKLHGEGFNAEVAATLATLAPHVRRPAVTRLTVALEVLCDYLDGLTERPSRQPLRDGRESFRALTDAVVLSEEPDGGYYRHRSDSDDGGYVEELVASVRSALRSLPAAEAVSGVARLTATRCAEVNVRAHAVPALGAAQLEAWARSEAATCATELDWRELMAGSALSALSLHALMSAAADHLTTVDQAARLGAVYASISALATMLDCLVDGPESSFACFYEDHDVLVNELIRAARRAMEGVPSLPGSPDHLMLLVGVVAYYASHPNAQHGRARPAVQRLTRELRPLIWPTLGVLHAWRLAKRVRGWPRARRATGGAVPFHPRGESAPRERLAG
jgi:tetraprenyl-beta-curcumene synthase